MIEENSKTKLADFRAWREKNDSSFNLFDYLHGVLSTNDVSTDLIFAIIELFWPEFINVDGMIFIDEQFDKGEYERLVNEGSKPEEVEYWLNLVNLDGLLPGIGNENCAFIGTKIAELWRLKLQLEYQDKKFNVSYLYEDDEQEHFVTFHTERLNVG